MPKSINITSPRPQATTQAELQSQIDSLNSDVYDCLTLNREHLLMLWKLVDTAIDDLSPTHDPIHAIKQAKRALFIAQHLAIDFLDCIAEAMTLELASVILLLSLTG